MKDMLHNARNQAMRLASELRPPSAIVKRTADKAVDVAAQIAVEVGHLGKSSLSSPLAKDAATGAAIGAALAIPVPVVGPMAGAVLGAGLGVYKNIKGSGATGHAGDAALQDQSGASPALPSSADDRYDLLARLHELKVKGVLTEEEFSAEKKKILDR